MTSQRLQCTPLVIGVVGHRPDVIRDTQDALLRQQVRDVLRRICRGGDTPTLVSPVAEGADRLVAHEALSLGVPLVCLLPFPREVYAEDFASPGSRAEYADLLNRAVGVLELRGSRKSNRERIAAYVALSDALLDRIQLLLAIWDGDSAHGAGGTGDSVKAAVSRGIPVIWIDASSPHDMKLLTGAERDETRVTALDQLFEQFHVGSARRCKNLD